VPAKSTHADALAGFPMTYTLVKSLHIVAVISWMAGLLYLYRLYVNHRAEAEAVVQERFRGMERRLWRGITVPAAWVAVLSGASMIALRGCVFASQGWLSAKLLLAVGLLAMHFLAGRYRRAFEAGPLPRSTRWFRVLNEIPTVLMIGIVLLVEFQPDWGRWPVCG
jgi:protoporphyrinogen IX oxidase